MQRGLWNPYLTLENIFVNVNWYLTLENIFVKLWNPQGDFSRKIIRYSEGCSQPFVSFVFQRRKTPGYNAVYVLLECYVSSWEIWDSSTENVVADLYMDLQKRHLKNFIKFWTLSVSIESTQILFYFLYFAYVDTTDLQRLHLAAIKISEFKIF